MALPPTAVIESDFLPIGSRFSNVPLHSGSVWVAYDLQEGVALKRLGLEGMALKGLGFGGGVWGKSERLGNNAGTFKLDGFVVADLAAWHRFTLPWGQRIKAQINVNNLFDEKYVESSNGTASEFPGAPRTFIGSLAIEF